LSEESELHDCSILLLHHEGKSRVANNLYAAKGSSSIIAAAGGSWHLHKDDPSSTVVHFEMGKMRDVDKYVAFDYEQIKAGDIVKAWQRQSQIKILPLNKKHEEKDENLLVLKIISYNEGICKVDLQKISELDSVKLNKITKYLEKSLLIETKGKCPKKHYITENGKSYIWGENSKA
jgi:hypothetical protein